MDIASEQKRFIDLIKLFILKHKNDLNNDSVYLSGSLGRGEAKIGLFENQVRLINDVDILIITNDSNKLRGLNNQFINYLKNNLKLILKTKFIDIGYESSNYLYSNSLESYEFNLTSILIYGKELRRSNIVYKKPPTINFLKYLYNRLAGIVLFKIDPDKSPNDINYIYQYIKAWIAYSDCFIYDNEEYYPPYYKERLDLLLSKKILGSNELKICIDCYKYKLSFSNELNVKKITNLKNILILYKKIYMKLIFSNFKNNKEKIKLIEIFTIISESIKFFYLIKLSFLFTKKQYLSKRNIVNYYLNKIQFLLLKNTINTWLTKIGH